MRQFDSGATRDSEDGKLDFDGFLSPEAIRAFAEYMHRHRVQSDGTLRAGDNWKKGIPRDAYMKSMWRHFFDVWSIFHSSADPMDLSEPLCALFFNVQGMLDSIEREKAFNRKR